MNVWVMMGLLTLRWLMPLSVWIPFTAAAIGWSWWWGKGRAQFAWWLMGCPFTGWREADGVVPWDYRVGMRLMPTTKVPS